jgi:hypothetical protein
MTMQRIMPRDSRRDVRSVVGRPGKHDYYVFIPGYRITAEVRDAPTTKHARTAFLDFLVRQRRIPYIQRARARRRMKTLRVKRGEIPSSVVLDYDMPEPYTEMPISEAPYTEDIESPESVQVDGEALAYRAGERRPVPAARTPLVPGPIVPAESEIDIFSSPITDIARRQPFGRL